MSDTNNRPPVSESERGVMGSLPTTRPQRTSARRAKAREQAKPTPARREKATPKQATPAPKPKPKRSPRATKGGEIPRAPRQGFETEGDLEPGKSVSPPNSAELAASMVELIGELAQTGLSSGGRLLRDALSRLPRG